jgi:hypothetical protein
MACAIVCHPAYYITCLEAAVSHLDRMPLPPDLETASMEDDSDGEGQGGVPPWLGQCRKILALVVNGSDSGVMNGPHSCGMV